MTNMPAMDASAEPTSDDKLWTLLTYIFSPILPLILMVWEDKKSRPFIRSHNAQALVLGVLNVGISIVGSFVVIGPCIGFLIWAYGVYCGIQGYQGKQVTIPVITDFCKNQGWA